MAQLDFPDHIAHTPVFVVPYFNHDPDNDKETDAQFLSVGWSQWDDDEPSAKVVRYAKSGRWSRQSEELPLGRIVDLAMLTALAYGRGGAFTTLEAGMLERQKQPIDVAYGSKRDRLGLVEALRENETLRDRLRTLHQVLKEIAEEGLL